MPLSTIEDENTSGNSSESTEAGEGSQIGASEVHDEIMGDPIEEAGLVSTTEFRSGEDDASGDDNSDSDSSESDSEGEGDGSKELSDEDKAKLDATFQDSPRFQELITQKNEARAQAQEASNTVSALQKQVETLTDLVKGLGGDKQQTQQQQTQKPGYTDVLQLSDEKIIEGFESDPKGFLANFAMQVKDEVTQALMQQGQQQMQQSQRDQQAQAIDQLYADYESKNPDFVEAWEKGEVQKFMQENAGNTPISAWEIMKARAQAESFSKEKETDIQKAVDEAVAKATQNFKVKQSSRTLSGGPGGGAQKRTSSTPAELADTAKHGGLYTVLAKRSEERARRRG